MGFNLNFDDLEKIKEKYGAKKALIILVLLFFMAGFATCYFLSKYTNLIKYKENLRTISNEASVNQVITGENISVSTSESSNTIKCDKFEDCRNDWSTDYYKNPDNDGFYCPSTKKYPFPKLWYKNLISTNFKSIEIRYELKNKKNDSNTCPPFVFAIGKDNEGEILRLFIPEVDPWLVGVEKRTKGDLLEREESKRNLDESMQYGGIVEFKIEQAGKMLDQFVFDVYLTYKSTKSDKPAIKVLRIDDIISPDPNLDNESSGIDIGFGTEEGYCIKPLSYKIIRE